MGKSMKRPDHKPRCNSASLNGLPDGLELSLTQRLKIESIEATSNAVPPRMQARAAASVVQILSFARLMAARMGIKRQVMFRAQIGSR